MNRCADCFDDLGRKPRYAVVKTYSLTPEEQATYDASWPDVLALATAKQVFVCADCAGWYGDAAVKVRAEEAGE